MLRRNPRLGRWVAGALWVALAACQAGEPEEPSRARPPAPWLLTRRPAAERIVAVGDLHGDLAATRRALRLAGIIDDEDRWVGGETVLVQTGDVLDRGDGERQILDLLYRLRHEAPAVGGSVVALNGNHEVMNVQGDFRYVTAGGFTAFSDLDGLDHREGGLSSVPGYALSRAAAFLPGGPMARRLATRNLIAVVGENVFVHGGILPRHVEYGLDRMNGEVRAWMLGELDAPPQVAVGRDGPIWVRDYSLDPGAEACRRLGEALALLSARRMVVGHTVQPGGIRSFCGGALWCIDVGMADHYGGTAAVLEIRGPQIRARSAGPAAP